MKENNLVAFVKQYKQKPWDYSECINLSICANPCWVAPKGHIYRELLVWKTEITCTCAI